MGFRLIAVVLVLFVMYLTDARGQVHKGRTPGELKQLVNDALASGKRIGALQPRIGNGQVVFDVTLVPNPDSTEWMMLLNLTPQQFEQARGRYAGEGFTLGATGVVSANNQQYHSAVWLKTRAVKRPLVLPAGAVPEAGESVSRLGPVDEVFRSFMRTHNAAGVTVAIGHDGRVVYDRAFGWADVRKRKPMQTGTTLRIADVSRTLTAVAVMQLIQQRKLSLHEPVVSVLRKGRQRGISNLKDPRWNTMTVQHVLQHTAGFSSAPVFLTPLITREFRLRKPANRSDIIRYHLRQPLDFTPGERFAYSDFGYCLLGRLIEIVADQTYGAYVRDHILTPANMDSTRLGRTRVDDRPATEAWYHMQNERTGAAFWSASVPKVARAGRTIKPPEIVREPDGMWNLEVMNSAAGWTSTAADLVRFVSAIDGQQAPLLSPEARGLMWRPPLGKEGDAEWYACGWLVRGADQGNREIRHQGGLAGTSASLVGRHKGLAWAVLFNTDVSTNGKPLAAEIDPLVRAAVAKVDWSK